MEQKNRLEQNRYSKPFFGPSAAQEADSFMAGNDKEESNTCVAAAKVDNVMETLMGRQKTKTEGKKTQVYHKNQKHVGRWGECWVIDSLVVIPLTT